MSRLDALPPYLFSALDTAKRRRLATGAEVIDLGIGDPDLPTPRPLVEAMRRALGNPAHHRYPAQKGTDDLRRAISAYMSERYGVDVDPVSQVLVLIGSKEGLGHLPLAHVREGDDTLVPDLGYPVYAQATLLAGGIPRAFPLRAATGFLPQVEELAGMVGERTRLVFLNYPHNPTGAVADGNFWSRVLSALRGSGAVLVNDAAYLEVTTDGSLPVSMLADADLGEDRVIELHSLSKMFNMTGWRIGFAVGNAEVIAGLARVKESMDSGVFGAVQETAAFAWGPRRKELWEGVRGVYRRRHRIMVEALSTAGYEVFPSEATFYVWARVPGDEAAEAFCARALEQIGVVLTPGTGFGPGGEGWFRVSLTAGDEDIAAGARLLKGWS